MLGQALLRRLEDSHEVVALNSRDLDIGSLEQTRRTLSEIRPDWVVNAAGYTAVDQAETETEEAFRVNALGARNLAAAACRIRCRLLSYSTDYVFDGTAGRPYREWDPASPISQYGRSKWVGEQFIRQHCPDHLILRTSWLYGPGGKHFVATMLRLAESRDQLRVVDDQIGSPTYTLDLAAVSRTLMESDCRGTYHVTNSGECSWHDFAKEIFRLSGSRISLEPCTTREYPLPAPRPQYSVLENYMLKLEGLVPPRHWSEAVADFLERQRAQL